MSQKPRPLVPAIQTPPPGPPAPPPPSVELAMSGASAVTRPSSAGLRNSVHRPRTGSRQPSCSGVAATSVSARSVSATIGVRSAGCPATSGGTATGFSPGDPAPPPPPPRRRPPPAAGCRRDGAGARRDQPEPERVPFSGRGIDAHQARAVRAEKQLAPVRRARRGCEAIARKPGVREDEGAHRLREWRLRERGAGVEWRDALPRRRARPVWHGKERPTGQESPPGGALHEDAARLIARVEHQTRDAARDDSLLPRPDR